VADFLGNPLTSQIFGNNAVWKEKK
jgi:hypothetical protein